MLYLCAIGGYGMEYITRIADAVFDRKMRAFNAISIVGPQGCGKTRTAKERCLDVSMKYDSREVILAFVNNEEEQKTF